jgi:hypothetical protein
MIFKMIKQEIINVMSSHVLRIVELIFVISYTGHLRFFVLHCLCCL